VRDRQTVQLKFWTRPLDLLWQDLPSLFSSLSQEEAGQRQETYGLNMFTVRQEFTPLKLLLNQFKSLIEFSLIFTTRFSVFLQDSIGNLRGYSIQQKSFLQGEDAVNDRLRGYCLASTLFTIGKFVGGNIAWLTNLRYDCRYYHFMEYFRTINERRFYQRFYA
jgi:hypothetical protein